MITQNIEKITTLTNSLTNELSIILSWSTELEQLDKQYNDKLQKLHDVEARVNAKLHENKQAIISLANDKKELDDLAQSIAMKNTVIEKQDTTFKAKMIQLDKREQLIKGREQAFGLREELMVDRETQVEKVKSILEKEQAGQRELKARLDVEDKKLKERSEQLSKILV